MGSHQCAHVCLNTAGSYTCSCNNGYRLNSDGISCNGKDLVHYKIFNQSFSSFETSMNVLKADISVAKTVTILTDLMNVSVILGIS